jgi:hypothetical protein
MNRLLTPCEHGRRFYHRNRRNSWQWWFLLCARSVVVGICIVGLVYFSMTTTPPPPPPPSPPPPSPSLEYQQLLLPRPPLATVRTLNVFVAMSCRPEDWEARMMHRDVVPSDGYRFDVVVDGGGGGDNATTVVFDVVVRRRFFVGVGRGAAPLVCANAADDHSEHVVAEIAYLRRLIEIETRAHADIVELGIRECNSAYKIYAMFQWIAHAFGNDSSSWVPDFAIKQDTDAYVDWPLYARRYLVPMFKMRDATPYAYFGRSLALHESINNGEQWCASGEIYGLSWPALQATMALVTNPMPSVEYTGSGRGVSSDAQGEDAVFCGWWFQAKRRIESFAARSIECLMNSDETSWVHSGTLKTPQALWSCRGAAGCVGERNHFVPRLPIELVQQGDAVPRLHYAVDPLAVPAQRGFPSNHTRFFGFWHYNALYWPCSADETLAMCDSCAAIKS